MAWTPRGPRGLARRLGGKLAWKAAFAVGYILSPASWWNDLVVNVPLALAIAKALEPLGVPLATGFVLGYWLTNALGVLLMAAGVGAHAPGSSTRRSLLLGLAASTAYTVAAWLLLGRLG